MTEWNEIKVDKHGFITDECRDEMYSHLPILIAFVYDDESYPIIDYVDAENWSDSVSDFSKEACRYWATTQAIEMPKED